MKGPCKLCAKPTIATSEVYLICTACKNALGLALMSSVASSKCPYCKPHMPCQFCYYHSEDIKTSSKPHEAMTYSNYPGWPYPTYYMSNYYQLPPTLFNSVANFGPYFDVGNTSGNLTHNSTEDDEIIVVDDECSNEQLEETNLSGKLLQSQQLYLQQQYDKVTNLKQQQQQQNKFQLQCLYSYQQQQLLQNEMRHHPYAQYNQQRYQRKKLQNNPKESKTQAKNQEKNFRYRKPPKDFMFTESQEFELERAFDRFKKLRADEGLSIDELALKLKVDINMVAYWFQNRCYSENVHIYVGAPDRVPYFPSQLTMEPIINSKPFLPTTNNLSANSPYFMATNTTMTKGTESASIQCQRESTFDFEIKRK